MFTRFRQLLNRSPAVDQPVKVVGLPALRKSVASVLGSIGRLRLAEHFQAPPNLAAVHIPLGGIDDLATAIDSGLLVAIVIGVQEDATLRTVTLEQSAIEDDGARLAFIPFKQAASTSAYLIACDRLVPGFEAFTAEQLKVIVQELAPREPIHISCNEKIPDFSALRIPLHPIGWMHAFSECLPQSHTCSRSTPQMATSDARIAYAIENVWMENRDVLLRGWIHGYAQAVSSIQVRGPKDEWLEVTDRSARPDLIPHYPMIPDNGSHCGFSVLIPDVNSGPVTFKATLEREEVQVTSELPKRLISEEDLAACDAYQDARLWFIGQVNERKLSVLEIGSRLVGPGATSWRPEFSEASRFVGFDVHQAPGVDVVGDAHTICDHVGRGSVDAVFSVAVLEHIAMPWVLARELNRVLTMGGLTFHITVQSWPVHEEPNDFWRYTDEALRLLFGPLNGFEVIGAGMCQRVRMYPEMRGGNDPGMGFFPGYGNAWVLARKVSEMPDDAESSAHAGALAELSRRYPRHGATTDCNRAL